MICCVLNVLNMKFLWLPVANQRRWISLSLSDHADLFSRLAIFSSKNVRAVEVLCRCKLCLLWIHGPELVNKRQLQSALADLGLSKHIPKWEIPLKFNGIIIIFIGFISFNHHFPAFLVTGHNFQAPKEAWWRRQCWCLWRGARRWGVGAVWRVKCWNSLWNWEPMRVFFP